jgi:hypothetical protein
MRCMIRLTGIRVIVVSIANVKLKMDNGYIVNRFL